MDRWAERRGLSEEQTDDLEYHLSQMDEVYLKFKTKKLKSSIEASSKSAPKRKK